SIKGITPGRAYRAYRFPQRSGGRMSRRVSAVRPVGTFAGILSAALFAGTAFVGVCIAAVIGYFAADLPAAHDLATVPIPLATHIYDRTGQHLLYTLADEQRELISLDAVPERMQDATIAIEDKTFWSNPGVDVGGIIRAFQANASSGRITQGGSTITQQLIKTRLLGDDPTFTRKIKEAILAIEATRTFSKKQILEMYFNQIYYGNQAYGLKAAAATYFGIADLNKLTLAQMALLAGLPQAPSDYDPIQNMPAAMARRAQVLDAMVDNGYATQAEADAAKSDYGHAGIALRQPGSTFKLFTYLTGMQKLGLTASSRLYDIQFTMQDGSGKPYSPKDATKEQHGPLTLRQALRESLNLPALE